MALTGSVVLVVKTRASNSGTLLVTVTSTALLPSPVGEVTTEGVASPERPLSATMLLATLVASLLDPVEP